MSRDLHTIGVLKQSSGLARSDRLQMVLQKQVSYVAGTGAGAAVATTVTGLELPANYAVFVSVDQDATYFSTSRSPTGFTFTLTPRLAANTLAAGKVDILILA